MSIKGVFKGPAYMRGLYIRWFFHDLKLRVVFASKALFGPIVDWKGTAERRNEELREMTQALTALNCGNFTMQNAMYLSNNYGPLSLIGEAMMQKLTTEQKIDELGHAVEIAVRDLNKIAKEGSKVNKAAALFTINEVEDYI